jgi:hypothetical protein
VLIALLCHLGEIDMQLAKNIFISFVVAGKSANEVFEQWELDSPHRPRFGRNWWFWLPSLKTNGGRFRCHENTDINFHWLCCSISFTVFSWRCKA